MTDFSKCNPESIRTSYKLCTKFSSESSVLDNNLGSSHQRLLGPLIVNWIEENVASLVFLHLAPHSIFHMSFTLFTRTTVTQEDN